MNSIERSIITATGHGVSIETNIREVWVDPLMPGATFIDTIRPRGHIICGRTFKIDGEIVTTEEVNKVLENEGVTFTV